MAIETIVEDEMIATGDRIDHVLETAGTELIVKQEIEVSLIAREKIVTIVEDEMIEIAIKEEIDAIEETLKWKDLARQDVMTAEALTVIFIRIFINWNKRRSRRRRLLRSFRPIQPRTRS